MKPSQFHDLFLYVLLTIAVSGCTWPPIVKPTTHQEAASPQDSAIPPPQNIHPEHVNQDSLPDARSPVFDENLDFAEAFIESVVYEDTLLQDTSSTEHPQIPVILNKPPVRSSAAIKKFTVSGTDVRVALKRDLRNTFFYSLGEMDIRSTAKKANKYSFRGRIEAEILPQDPGGIHLRSASFGKITVSLPCTLLARNHNNFFEYGDASYRGSVILDQGDKAHFLFVNVLPVEDYLRGVVPLEIGKRSKEDLEAVKAQAVAARTYTYKRIVDRPEELYDLLPDVSDQVYGGVHAEDPVSDRAIALTRDIIIISGNSLCMAYYHSTCGGTTANVEDVWGNNSETYLKSIPDKDSYGQAYCGISNRFFWEEKWSAEQFMNIIKQYSPRAFPAKPVPAGVLSRVEISRRFTCGRVAQCIVRTSGGAYMYGGDRIRFVFRRNAKDFPILRSARFEIVQADSKGVIIRGQGFGHGVGMCQMGALARARKGLTFEQILTGYYTGVNIAVIQSESH